MNGYLDRSNARALSTAILAACIAVLAVLTMITPVGAAAQGAGRIMGRVTDAETGAPLPSVQITIATLSRGTLTDAQGRYVLVDVPAGTHPLTASSLGYGTASLSAEVTGGATRLDISLTPRAVALEGVTVSAARERGSNTSLLAERRGTAVVSDAIGAEQISRAPDGDVAAALRRVPGVTVVDGKYVYIRGLGERYGATTLNGAPMPSPLPDRKTVPLDVIPSDLLESVTTSKSYLPDQPGDYAGGLVQIRTRDVPASRTFQLSASAGYNTSSSFRPTLGFGGGNSLLLGVDGGPDPLPASVFGEERVTLPTDETARSSLAHALTNRFGPGTVETPLNRSYGLTFGDRLSLLGRPLGIIGTVTASESYSTPANAIERLFVSAGDEPRQDYDFAVAGGSRETGLGALISASAELAADQRVTVVGNYNRLTDDQSRMFAGLYSGGDYFETYSTRYTSSSIANAQLRGEHVLPFGGVTLDWRTSFGRAGRREPGTRTVAYRGVEPGQPVYFQASQSSGVVLAQQLDEDLSSTALNVKVPFSVNGLAASIAVGASADFRDRDVQTRRILLTPVDDVSAHSHLPPDQLFVPERIGTESGQLMVEDRTFAADNYMADQSVRAAYATLDAEVLPRLRVAGGVRVESARQNVTVTGYRNGEGAGIPATRLDDTDLVPAVNVTYAVTDAMNIRGAVSHTLGRPQFRELSPFLYADYFGDAPMRGNPFLVRSRILNTDARWEWFFAPGALMSFGAFHKEFTDPIEPIAIMLGTNPGRTFANTESATVTGLEVELRTPLGLLTPALASLSVTGNLTVARSAVNGDEVSIYDPQSDRPLSYPVNRGGDRPLFGQSPYALNLGVTHFNEATGTAATVLFNRFGRRVDTTGGVELPDIYEEGRSQLDLTVEQPLARGVALKLSAARLLGGDVRFTQTFPNGDTVTTRSYEQGRMFSMSLSWRP